jgi:cation diffusion facilitator CzcD-associated flavoprotein CzcO
MILVVGGGPAGLATAAALGRIGLRAVVLEQAGTVAAAWRGRYDRMRLNTSRLTSRLPGLRYPPGTGLFPTRDEFVAYLECYVDHHGMEIAHDLAAGGAGLVRLSVRTPPSIVLRSMGGLPGDLPAMVLLRLPPRVGDSQVRVLQRLVLGDLAAHGLPVPTEGAFTRLRRLGAAPTVMDRQVVQAIRDRRIQIVSGLRALDTNGATLADGTWVEADAVVAATGYRRGLEGLVGHLGVLDERGTPAAVGERAPAPGLRFVGFVPRPGQLHHMGVEARRAARSIARELRRPPAAGQPSPSRSQVAAKGHHRR